MPVPDSEEEGSLCNPYPRPSLATFLHPQTPVQLTNYDRSSSALMVPTLPVKGLSRSG